MTTVTIRKDRSGFVVDEDCLWALLIPADTFAGALEIAQKLLQRPDDAELEDYIDKTGLVTPYN